MFYSNNNCSILISQHGVIYHLTQDNNNVVCVFRAPVLTWCRRRSMWLSAPSWCLQRLRCTRPGVGNLRPAGRMRPAKTFDAAGGIFWFVCKIVPKTRFVLLTALFSYNINKASIDTLISKWNYYIIDLKNDSILKVKFKDMESANCYASLKHEFACHEDDCFILIDKHLLLNFLLHEHHYPNDLSKVGLILLNTLLNKANRCKFTFRILRIWTSTHFIQD